MDRGRLPGVALAAGLVAVGAWMLLRPRVPDDAVTRDSEPPTTTTTSTSETSSPKSAAVDVATESVHLPNEAKSEPSTEPVAVDPRTPNSGKYREALLKIRDRDSACRELNEIRGGWNGGRAGLERVHAALEEWNALLGVGPHPWKGPALLALANAKHGLGEPEKSLDCFIDALLAMDREGPQPPWGIPRLVFFGGGPNLAPYSEKEFAWRNSDTNEFGTHDDIRSGGWAFFGGSPIIGLGTEGKEFGEWLVGIARDDAKPESALAATIWLHAVSSRPWHIKGFHAPAAVRLMLAWRPGGDLSERGSTIWWQGFTLAYEEALSREDPAAIDLRTDYAKWNAWRATPAARRSQVSTVNHVNAWSLRQEVLVRFSKMTTERGKALKTLAERLVAWD